MDAVRRKNGIKDTETPAPVTYLCNYIHVNICIRVCFYNYTHTDTCACACACLCVYIRFLPYIP